MGRSPTRPFIISDVIVELHVSQPETVLGVAQSQNSSVSRFLCYLSIKMLIALSVNSTHKK